MHGNMPAMNYTSYNPRSPLATYVDRFWACSDVPIDRPVRILPTGGFELVFNLSADEIRVYDNLQANGCLRHSGAVFAGAYNECLLIDPMHRASMLGVHFKPRGAYPFLGARADELADQHVNINELWGSVAAELRERLCTLKKVEQRFALLEETLVARLRLACPTHCAVSIAIATFDQTDGQVRVHGVANRVGLSQRRLIQAFAAEVGLTPKRYCRMRRFQKVRDLLSNAQTPNWAQLAVDCGYCDQSHLIREFQTLSGLTPANYLRQSSALHGHANHILETI